MGSKPDHLTENVGGKGYRPKFFSPDPLSLFPKGKFLVFMTQSLRWGGCKILFIPADMAILFWGLDDR